MQPIKVKKESLIATLKANRAKHREVFLEALEGFRKRVLEELSRMVEDTKSGRHIRLEVGLERPVDMTGEYDRVLAMMEWDTGDEVTLNEVDFNHFVRDKWSWSGAFKAANEGYVISSAATSYLGTIETE